MEKMLREFIARPFFELASTTFLLLVYFLFLYRHAIAIKADQISPTTFVFVIMETIVILLLILRRRPKTRRAELLPWIFALSGTFLPLLLMPSGYSIHTVVGETFIVVGGSLAILSYLSLNTSFGVSPALREIKTSFLYSFVRHPMYLSYCVIFTGYLFVSFSWYNLLLIFTAILCLLFRIHFEEQLLLTDRSYQVYSNKVVYKLLPGIY
jgi:protein-S-isoprenylcysteine O-methyltransferase Ste14